MPHPQHTPLPPTAQRAAALHRLATEEFDLCIIGGGASGAGCALDAALRGLKVALVERDDFAAGTSSRSTKLVHGGVRYLEQAFKKGDFAQLKQVQHGLRERHRVLANAPHLARPLALLTPVFSWWEGLYFSIGLKLYDWFAARGRHRLADGMAGKDQLPTSRWLSRSAARLRMPGLSPRIHSAVLYHDGQLDDARYCLALALSAAEASAVVVNHLEVLDFQKDEVGRIMAATFQDRLSQSPHTLRAKQFLNCTGPFADHIRLLANPALAPRIRPSKGVHAVLPYATLGSDDAMLIPKTKDGRMVFAIPFQGRVLLGTTDEDCPDPNPEPVLNAREVDFLLETLNPFLTQPMTKEAVTAGFGGLRPLVNPAPTQSTQTLTRSLLRDHEIEHDPTSNLLSLLGGKWTTYRIMAQDAVDSVCHRLGVQAKCRTREHRLVGAAGYTTGFWKKIQAEYGLESEIAQHLAQQYGTRAVEVAALAQENVAWGGHLVADFPFLKAEIVYAVRRETAYTLRDVLARRIRLEILDWEAVITVAPTVAQIMGAELGWSQQEMEQETEAYIALIRGFRTDAQKI